MPLRRVGFLVLLAALPATVSAQKFYPDDPVLTEPKLRNAVNLKNRKLSDAYDLVFHTLATPGQRQRPATPIPSQGINTLGDPIESAWWEKRHYWKRMSEEELMRGAGGRTPPRMDVPWQVTGGKGEGVTPGFNIRDGDGRVYHVKFDSIDYPELGSGADQIALRIFHALGYHVPDNYLVYFTDDQLRIGPNVKFKDDKGHTRLMSDIDLALLLRRAPVMANGRYRATASLAVEGDAIGPYRYNGTRADDPNDTVPHEHRRDLRGMHLAAAWVDHDDSRALNTYDAVQDRNGISFVKHYQLDFGSTLGSASYKPNSPRSGGEYLFSWRNASINFLTLGLYVPEWARAEYPDIPSVGRFESKRFDPDAWVPEYPNPAFLNRLPDDEFWMAKQIMNLTDSDIRAIVRAAQYTDPRASEYITTCLIERRNKIGRAAYGRVLPLDRFAIDGGRLVWEDISLKHGFGGVGALAIRWSRFDNAQNRRYPETTATTSELPPMIDDGYWVADITQLSATSHRVAVYLRRTSNALRIAGVEYFW
jgi:hypothetical protein